MARSTASLLAAFAMFPAAAMAQYSATTDGEIIHLEDAARHIRVSIAPKVGNLAFEMSVNGHNILHFPYPDLAAAGPRPNAAGIPFLAPWANRLDEQAFYANGKRYPLNMSLGNVRGAQAMHGFLTYTDKWVVKQVKADRNGAWVTSEIEFWQEPSFMAQFPFAHTIQMTHRLSGGILEVNLQLHNLSSEPMPVSIGFHPYYQLSDSPRDEWTISLAARKQWLLTPGKIPTGETAPIEGKFPDPQQIALRDYNLDDVFSDLTRDADGRAIMKVKGKSQQIEAIFGPKYNTVVVYAPKPNPQGEGFVCFEPMAGITDAMNLAQKGVYHDLQMLPPGAVWQESFWIRPTGF